MLGRRGLRPLAPKLGAPTEMPHGWPQTAQAAMPGPKLVLAGAVLRARLSEERGARREVCSGARPAPPGARAPLMGRSPGGPSTACGRPPGSLERRDREKQRSAICKQCRSQTPQPMAFCLKSLFSFIHRQPQKGRPQALWAGTAPPPFGAPLARCPGHPPAHASRLPSHRAGNSPWSPR
jgi:hypothetical protein